MVLSTLLWKAQIIEVLVSQLAERHSHQLASIPARPLPSCQLLAVPKVTESWEGPNGNKAQWEQHPVGLMRLAISCATYSQ